MVTSLLPFVIVAFNFVEKLGFRDNVNSHDDDLGGESRALLTGVANTEVTAASSAVARVENLIV